ncbi:MAG: hydratase, partial [Lachnospiraceae bacterium]|nr:hydratase [Lachnospiraceae bacterium]
MIKLYDHGVYIARGERLYDSLEALEAAEGLEVRSEVGFKLIGDEAEDQASKGTMAYGILKAHNQSEDMDHMRLKFDSLASHDITYVGIIQTARASGLTEFPMPYLLTNCHNSLCAVGGTINEDDHKFALSAAHKFGGIYVPANLGNIH